MAWQSSTINPATTSPAADISKITNDLQQLRGVIGGTPDAAIPSVWTTTAAVVGQTANSGTTAGTSTAYTLTPATALAAYTAGSTFWVTFHTASGASPTLQISGLSSPPNLVKQDSTGAYVNIAAGDFPANHRSRVTLLSATQALVEELPPVAAGPGFKNLLINGSMAIDQRNAGASRTFTAGAALAYSVDRWYGYCTGANVTGQRVAGTAPNQFNYQFTGAASVTKIGHAQRIEAANSQHLAGTTATLSVDLANSLLTTVTWTAWYATTADTFGTLASPTRTQIATGTFTVNSTLARYNAQISIPGAATTGIEVEFSVGAQTSGTWTIGRAQLEAGSVATPFEVRPIAVETALAQRYYYRLTAQTADQFGASLNFSTTQALGMIPFPVTMRADPSALEQSGTASDYRVYTSAGNTACSAVPVIDASGTASAGMATFTVASGLTAGQASALRAAVNNAYLGWSAEL